MTSLTQSPHFISKDGSSQQDRYLDALRPDYVPVDGRSLEDLILEAQRLAKEIRYVNEQDQTTSNWEAMLLDDANDYYQKSETGREIQRKRWAKQLAAYVEDPESFQKDSKLLAQVSRPHVVMFLTFLQLINHIQCQLNGLTKKHLNFYFLERLGFTPKEAVPDVVNVLLELASDVEQLELKKGTVFTAGTDEDGNELHYEADRDTVISRASIAQVKTVFVDKKTLGIRDAHLLHINDLDKGFDPMMGMALGQPGPGDALPPFPNGIESWEELLTLLGQQAPAAMDFVQNQLFFSPREDFRDFRFVVETHLKDLDANQTVEPQAWEEVYRILDQAYKKRVRKGRQEDLEKLKESDPQNGVNNLLKEVYGRPEAGDELPLYRGQQARIADIFADLIATANNLEPGQEAQIENNRQEAREYISEELFLSEQDFVKLAQVLENPQATPAEWTKIYEVLELANRKVRTISLPSPRREELSDVFAEPDAPSTGFSLYDAEEESLRFRTFGGPVPGKKQALKPARLGFALSSPLLVLREGKRTITATLSIDPLSAEKDQLDKLFNQKDTPPFEVYLSSEEAWIPADQVTFSFGDYVLGEPEDLYTGSFSNNVLSVSAGAAFDSEDLQKLLVGTDGVVWEILHIRANDEADVRQVGQVRPANSIEKYLPGDLALHALQIKVNLPEEALPVLPVSSSDSGPQISSSFPTLALTLRHDIGEEHGQNGSVSKYQKLMGLRIGRIILKVKAEGISLMSLLNDQTSINPQKPFAPFGNTPETGNSFYLANEEICGKKIDHLSLDFEWMKAPENFRQYYENYWKVEANNPQLSQASFTIQGNEDFKANVFLRDQRTELPLSEIALFNEGGRVEVRNIPQKIRDHSATFSYEGKTDLQTGDEVLDWERYFKLELEHRDFQHGVYNDLLRQQALSQNPGIRTLKLNQPWAPRLKKMKLGYSAHTEILLGKNTRSATDCFFHLHPFGSCEVAETEAPCLLPTYDQEGQLYLGIEKMIAPQTLSILFQLSEGSADPERERAPLQWSYLKENNWIPLADSAVLSDTTNGLVNTGIVQIDVPADAGGSHSLMPGELHWLKVTCSQNTAGVSDTIELRTQAISATFSSKKVAASHFVNLLSAQSIKDTQEFIPEIKEISQPYTSSKGKPTEQDAAFYNRISERLRHKNRAINMWDYERMVLEQFPEVYKAKCMPATPEQNAGQKGTVNVLVIPDIKGKLPFNPFEPKVPADTLLRIREFLDQHSPIFAEVSVCNPSYTQIKTRCVVKFKAGYNEGFYKSRLIEEIKRFLAPWAYDEGGNISIGGTIHASVLINFIAERPYIDYVANLKLFQSEDGKRFTDARALNDGKNQVTSRRPDTILVSAQNHEIDVVDENGYDEENFEGINYMKVELDFQVGENLLSQS